MKLLLRRLSSVGCLIAIVTSLLPAASPMFHSEVAASSLKSNTPQTSGVISATAVKTASGVLISWGNASTDDNLGFNVYSLSEGRRRRLNRSIVPGAVFASSGQSQLNNRSYAFLDRAGRADSVYQVESVTVSGEVAISHWIKTTPGVDLGPKVASQLNAGGEDPGFRQTSYPGATHDKFSANGPIEDQWFIANQLGLKISIKRDGWYRVTHQQVTSAGFNPVVDIRNLRLYVDGREISIRTSKSSGSFSNGDYFEFFGRGLDIATTETRIHYLVAGTQPGKRIRDELRISAQHRTPVVPASVLSNLFPSPSQYWFPFIYTFLNGFESRSENVETPAPQMPSEDPNPEQSLEGTQSSSAKAIPSANSKKGNRKAATRKKRKTEYAHVSVTAPTSFTYTVERKDRRIFFFNVLNGDSENYFGDVVSTTPLNQTLTTPNPESSGDGPARLQVALQGVGTVPHQVNVSFNDVLLGTLTYFGLSRVVHTFDVPMSLINNGDNTVKFVSTISTVSLVDFTRITYPHALRADNDSLRLSLRPSHSVTVDGFTTPNLRLLDRTDPYAVKLTKPEVLQSAGSYSIQITASLSSGKARLLYAFPENHFETPAAFSLNHPSNLNRSSNGADLLLIAHRTLIPSAAPLINLRQSQGLVVSVVDVEDVYDEFSFGEHGPRAIKEFLSRASSVWTRKPRYVLLLGDASHDPRNYEGLGDLDLVPTKLIDATFNETSSDDWLSDFNNDGLPEIPVGRLPVGTLAQANLVISKIVSFSPVTVPQSALLVADDPTGYYFDFEAANDEVQSLLPSTMAVERVNRRTDPNARENLIRKFNSGQALVNYTGHGNLDTWTGASIFTNADAAKLTNAVSIVISQVYGGGGEAGSTYRNDFIELFNRGAWPVDLSGWSLQYASSNGSSWQVTVLPNVVVSPGKYFLVQLAQGAGGTTNLPTPDVTATTDMDFSAGKVALVKSTTALSGSGCPISSEVVDFIGYGNADCARGNAAPALTPTTAALRGVNGCTNTDANSVDFSSGAPLPRNSATTNLCINASTRLPFSFVVVMDCLNGLFQGPTVSGLAEVLMSAPNGGSVAAFASSGLTIPDSQHAMARQLYILLYGSQSIALGDAVKTAKAATTDIDVRRTWILFGDPSMKIR